MMDYMSGNGGWGPGSMPGFGFGWIFMLLFWGLLILGLVALVKWLFMGRGAGSPPPATKTPLQILEERYARGEIDRDEFEQKKRDLTQ